MNRRNFIKKMFRSLWVAVGMSGVGYLYARYLEPNMLYNNKQTIVSTKIPKTFHNFKIIQFSDTHLGFNYSSVQLERLVKKINAESPHLIVFTGDLIDNPDLYEEKETLIPILQQLKAPYGKYWIYGNHDHGGYGTRFVKEIMEQSNFKLLLNSYDEIKIEDDFIILAGLDDLMLGKPNISKTLKNVQQDWFTILLVHEPDFAQVATSYPVDLQLSGHSHGGQVRFPFVGHVYTPKFADHYVEGKYTFDQMALYVSRGIGTTRLPFRFLCVPEFYTFTLKSQ